MSYKLLGSERIIFRRKIIPGSYERTGVVAQEAGPYEVLAGSIHAFGGVAVTVGIHALHVVHGPSDTFGGILAHIRQGGVGGVGHEGFYTLSAGADEDQLRPKNRFLKELAAQPGGFVSGVVVVDVHHYESRCFEKAVAAPAGERAAGGDVGQKLLFEGAVGG